MKWNYWRVESDFRSSGLHRICRRHAFCSVNLLLTVTTKSTPAMGPSQAPIQWVPEGPVTGGKATEAWSHFQYYYELSLMLRKSSFLSTVYTQLMKGLNLLKPSGFFTYHQVEHSKILHGARFALSVLCGYQNRQRLLLYTSLTDWFL